MNNMPETRTRKSGDIDFRLSFFLNREGTDMNVLFTSCKKVRTSKYATNDVLYYEDTDPSGLYFLREGIVKLIKKGEAGNETTHSVVTADCYLGLCSMIRNKKHTATAVALEDALIDYIPKNEFFRLMARYPSTSHKILVVLCRLLDDAEDEIIALTDKSIKVRQ